MVIQQGDKWLAQITRQVTSKNTTVSKEQGGFASEQEAQVWGETQLAEFVTKQSTSNQRHSAHRKEMEEIKRQRSINRAEKTAAAKEAKTAVE